MTGADAHAPWRRSSRSANGGGNCVEVALGPGEVRIRDSKSVEAIELVVDRESWSDFVDAVKAGDFDRTRLADEA
jgi:hypothetical protein